MKMYRIERRFITLIEVMIVMFLIALITGVLAYNYKGSLDKGKEFKTKAGIERLETILNLAVSEHPSLLKEIDEHWEEVVKSSPLVQNAKDLIYDGWGNKYHVEVNAEGDIEVSSTGLKEYREKRER